MAFLRFNKHELVNLSYSLRREIILANKTGAYCNTSIVTCNTRRYHGLLAAPVDKYPQNKHMILSAVDESLILNGKQFNLGIHCYGDVYEPRGHKYVVDFDADPIPVVTYKVGEIVFAKSAVMAPDTEQILIKYELLEAPSKIKLQLKPFLAFRDVNALTQENGVADTSFKEIQNGVSFCMYQGYPDLCLQMNTKEASFRSHPFWYKGVTYSDEYRRGFDCREDLFVPGYFEMDLCPGESVILSASLSETNSSLLKKKFNSFASSIGQISSYHDQLLRCADLLKCNHNGHKMITAGFSWLYTGLLRETLYSLAGLTLYANGDKAEFEEILDNLISDEQERLFHKTTQVEAPLYVPIVLQQYIDFGADERKVWEKYGDTVKSIIESYGPQRRNEVSLQPNGLLWARMENVALSWMNAYINGRPVTERSGYQVETNAFWYNALCFAIEMEGKYGKDKAFITEWTNIRNLAKDNFQRTFWNERMSCLADFVDENGQNMDIRPNQLYALWVKFSPLDEELAPAILRVTDKELLTRRGIRTLSPRDDKYKGVYDGSQIERDLAYHQGSTRPFLLAPYVDVCFRIKGPSFWKKAEWLTEGFIEDLGKHGVGAFSELYDGDPPHEPHGAISSALSTSALLAVDYALKKNREEKR